MRHSFRNCFAVTTGSTVKYINNKIYCFKRIGDRVIENLKECQQPSFYNDSYPINIRKTKLKIPKSTG